MGTIVTDIRFLRKPTEEVQEGEDISEIVDSLFNGLKEFNAIGLSANQLGYNKRIFVMAMKPHPPICVVNPIITKVRGSRVREESCLSIPETLRHSGSRISLRRPQQITIKGLNQYFKAVKYKLSGFQARVACHEIDHLDGKLIIDYKEIPSHSGRGILPEEDLP